MGPPAQNVAAGEIEFIVNRPKESIGLRWVISSEDLMDRPAVGVTLDGEQVLVGNVPINPEAPAAKLHRVVGLMAVRQRGIVAIEISSVNAEKGIIAEFAAITNAAEASFLGSA